MSSREEKLNALSYPLDRCPPEGSLVEPSAIIEIEMIFQLTTQPDLIFYAIQPNPSQASPERTGAHHHASLH